ncbi:MAG: FUSC family protein [Armatimonadetes bacterium]|nr:FUSC family protein [Armatimonadota bacterium]
MRVGARVWKTALAVAAAIGISRLLGISHPVFAGVAAIICMQPTVAGSIRSGRERMQATIVGAVFSLAALMLLEAVPALQVARPLMVGLTVLCVMAVIIRLKWFDSLVLAAATVVVIMVLPPEENIYWYSASRTVVTFVGIVVAAVVNAVFLTPHYRLPLWQRLRELLRATDSAYRRGVEAFCRRDLAFAGEARGLLEQTEELHRGVLTRMQWLDEETKLRRSIHFREEAEVELLRQVVQIVTGLRQAVGIIVRVTPEVLGREPKYAREPAKVYDILWELAQISFTILDQVGVQLGQGAPKQGDTVPGWTEEIHRRMIKAIRDAYQAPLDIFPLVEVSVVAFHVRRITELARELADAVAARAA